MADGIGMPPGIGAGPTGRAGGPNPSAATNVHLEIARDIGNEVEKMILNAKRSSETKVGAEIAKMKTKMEAMNEKIKQITERIDKLDPASGAILKSDLQKSINKLEEVWESEVGVLKHELWQTIQAHNHNADLMKHHKDAIDSIGVRLSEAVPNQELLQTHNQLAAADKVLQAAQTKQQQLDQLQQRLFMVQQQLSTGLGGLGGAACWGAGMGLPFPMAGQLPVPKQAGPGGQQAAASGVGAASAKKAQGKKKSAPKAASKASGMSQYAAAATLNANAAEFVPIGGWGE
jgi:hypothetical protein